MQNVATWVKANRRGLQDLLQYLAAIAEFSGGQVNLDPALRTESPLDLKVNTSHDRSCGFRLYLGRISAASPPHLGRISAASRPRIGSGEDVNAD